MARPVGAARLLAGLLCLILCSACSASRVMREPDLRPVVTRVHLEGTKQLKKDRIRSRLGQRATHPLHWVPILNFVYPRFHLEGTAWEEDRTRIANVYAREGFFDARVLASQVLIRRTRKDGSPRLVWIVHEVDEGEPSEVRSVELIGHPAESLIDLGLLETPLPLREGDRFSMERVEASAQVLRARLAEAAYARARVEARVDAYPEEHEVDVHFDISPGTPGVFGPVSISGLENVRSRYVERLVRWKEGDPFDGKLVDATQQAIYDMGVFALVTVAPEVSETVEFDEEGREILPVAIYLKERKARSVEGGGGVGFSLGSFDVHGRIGFSHVNLGRRLLRFEAELTAGLVYLGPEDIGPGVDLTLDLSWPEFPVRTLTSYLRGGFDMNVRQGYKYYSPEGEIGVIWSPLRPFRLTVGYEVSYFGLYENRLDDTALSDLPSDDIVFDDGYLQSVLKQELVLDLRDNLLAPGRGLFASVSVDEALPPGRFRYVKVIGDLRGYVPLGTPRFVLALRGTGSYIGTYGDEDSVPIEEAIFAGGDGSVRGWKSRQLGPRAVEEDCSRRDCIIPLGGKVGFTGALELRGNPVAGLWLAGFTDFGRVWSSPEEIDAAARFFEDLQFTVGGGIRYDLAIGRLRLDFGIHPRAWTDEVFLARLYKPKTCETLDSCPEDERLEPPTWSFHFGIGESF